MCANLLLLWPKINQMANAIFEVPVAANEPVLSYAPGSPEKLELVEAIREMKSKESELHMHIGGENVGSGDMVRMFPPHELNHTLGHYHQGGAERRDGLHCSCVNLLLWVLCVRPSKPSNP